MMVAFGQADILVVGVCGHEQLADGALVMIVDGPGLRVLPVVVVVGALPVVFTYAQVIHGVVAHDPQRVGGGGYALAFRVAEVDGQVVAVVRPGFLPYGIHGQQACQHDDGKQQRQDARSMFHSYLHFLFRFAPFHEYSWLGKSCLTGIHFLDFISLYHKVRRLSAIISNNV